jgi:hypothetical protein
MYLPTWTCGGAIAKLLHSEPSERTGRMQIPRGSRLSSISGDGQSAEYHLTAASVLTFMSTIFPNEIVTEENYEDYPNIPAPTFLLYACIEGTVIFASTGYCYFMQTRNAFVPMETVYRVLRTPKFRLPCPAKCEYASVNSIHGNL